MAGFNKFANQTVATAAADTSTTASIFPTLTAKNLGSATPRANNGSNNSFEGFTGDGDWIAIPENGTTAVEYFNNAGASQFTVTLANVDAAIDQWGGWWFDDTDSLLYGEGVDVSTAPDTYYLFSINSAGTIANIGNDQPAVDFTTAVDWGTNASTVGSGSLQRAADGSGNFFLRNNEQEMEVDVTDGSIVSDPALISSQGQTLLTYKASTGEYVGFFDKNSAETTVAIRFLTSDGAHQASSSVSTLTGVPATTAGVKPTGWKGYLVFSTLGSGKIGVGAAETSVFDAWIVATIKALGIE